MTHMPATKELRAFEIFSSVPEGCRLELITDSYNSPHLRQGEFAVVDPRDREFVDGEVYVIGWPGGGRKPRSICQVRRRMHRRSPDGVMTPGIWFCPLCRPVFKANGQVDWNEPVFLSDGPLNPKYLPEYIIAKVIGVYQSPEVGAELDQRRLIGRSPPVG